MLRQGLYPDEHMDSWERFNERKLPTKEDFNRNLKLEDIPDTDYKHERNVLPDLVSKHLVQVTVMI